MPRFPRERVSGLLATAESAQVSVQERGRALEDAIRVMFTSIPGILQPTANAVDYANASEIDLLFPNRDHTKGIWFAPFCFLCECKNWDAPVGSREVVVFANKIRQRGCEFGVLVARNGITGDAAQLTSANHEIARALETKVNIVVLTWEDIRGIDSVKQLVDCIVEKWIRLKSYLTSEA